MGTTHLVLVAVQCGASRTWKTEQSMIVKPKLQRTNLTRIKKHAGAGLATSALRDVLMTCRQSVISKASVVVCGRNWAQRHVAAMTVASSMMQSAVAASLMHLSQLATRLVLCAVA